MRYYDNLDDINRRLGNTIIFFEGKPIQVIESRTKEKKMGLNYWSLPRTGEQHGWIDIKDPRLNYLRFRLGFVNYGGKLKRLIRRPVRSVIQGIHSDTVSVLDVKNKMWEQRLTVYNLLQDSESVENIGGIFVSMSRAKKYVEDGTRDSCAFHYDWAWQKLLGHASLVYKDTPIALVLEEGRPVKLDKGMGYLKEAVQELGIRTL